MLETGRLTYVRRPVPGIAGSAESRERWVRGNDSFGCPDGGRAAIFFAKQLGHRP